MKAPIVATVQAPLKVKSGPHTRFWRVMVDGRAVDSLLTRRRARQAAMSINKEAEDADRWRRAAVGLGIDRA